MAWIASSVTAAKLAWIAFQAARSALKKRDADGKPRLFDPDNKRPFLDFLRDSLHEAMVSYDDDPPPPKAS